MKRKDNKQGARSDEVKGKLKSITRGLQRRNGTKSSIKVREIAKEKTG